MPRNSSGVYTLPLPPVVTGGVIESDWANTTLEDIANVLTASLDRYGNGGMSAPFRLFDGSDAQPALAFISETNSGLYRPTDGEVSMSVLGTKKQSWTSAGTQIVGAVSATGDFNVTGDFGVTGDLGLTGDIRLNDNKAIAWGPSPSPKTYIAANETPGIFVVVTNNAERLRIDQNGSVGIGAPASVGKLDVTTDGGGIVVRSAAEAGTVGHFATWNTNVNQIQWYVANNTTEVDIHNARGAMKFFTVGGERMRITPAGDVGVGTTAPQHYDGYTTLTVDGPSTGGVLSVRRNGVVYLNISAGGGDVNFDAHQSGMLFRTGVGGTTRMTLTSGGLVGIGMVPVTLLDVAGQIRSANSDPASGVSMIATGAGGGLIQWFQSGMKQWELWQPGGQSTLVFRMDGATAVMTFATNGRITYDGPYGGGYEMGWKSIPQVNVASFYTVQNTDNGQHIMQNVVQAVQIPAGLSLGHVTTIYNNTGGSIGIWQGAGLELRWANGSGTLVTGNRLLGPYGTCTFYMITGGVHAVLTGVGLS